MNKYDGVVEIKYQWDVRKINETLNDESQKDWKIIEALIDGDGDISFILGKFEEKPAKQVDDRLGSYVTNCCGMTVDFSKIHYVTFDGDCKSCGAEWDGATKIEAKEGE